MTALRHSRRKRSVAALAVGALAITLAPATAALAAPTAAGAPAETSVTTDAAPGAAQEQQEHRVLIFTETTQYRHEEAITQGTPVLEAAFADAGIASDHTEDSSVFNDTDLAAYDALVMFQASGDPWTAEEKAALERYQQAGGGIVAIHNATDMRGSYEWWDQMIGSLMPGHAATGSSPGLPGTVRVEDRTHPSTEHLPQRWDRADEWYNFSTNVRGDAHVLATMDESTYDPGSNAMGADHPISWCKNYDGGRAWMTGMGHFGAHYTEEPEFVQHVVGGVEWAAGMVEGDCGGTKWDQFEKVALDSNTSAPFAMDVAPDGRVFFTELVRGQIRVYDPRTQTTTTAVTIPVYSGGEDGLLGIALDEDFENNGYLYQYYSPASEDDTDPSSFVNRLSRFTVTGSEPGATVIDPASEQVLLEVPARRLPDEPGHTGGGMIVDRQTGDLYLGVGDDVNPHSEPSGGYAPLSEREGTFHDARETSANTNDLRGKVLRIHPEDDGTYSIPEGNLFPEAEDTADQTLPEIYAMGFRNPFRFTIDPDTGDLGVADYSPDNGADNPDERGPAGIAEWNLIKEPGFFGWPLCMGDNEPFRDVDYTTSPETVGEFFDCDAPVNDSVRNTGRTELPAAQPADLWYGYERTSAPGVIEAGGGLAPMGGPFYQFDPELESDTKFPEYYDGKPFFYEWARNQMFSMDLKDPRAGAGESDVEKVNPFLPTEEFLAPIDSKFGPDGSMYVLDWGGGFGRHNPDSGLHRIDYVTGSRSPEASIGATPDSGQAPLEVTLDGTASSDPEDEELTYEWDVDGDGTVDSTDATTTHTFTENGVYDVRLTVTDPHGKTGTSTKPVTVGNTQPEVDFALPPNGSFFEFGDTLSWDVSVTDAEDSPDGAEIDDSRVIIQPALGHDAHAHPSEPLHGRTGSVETDLGGGHSDDMNVFYVLDARYEDDGGDGVPTLTGSDTSQIYPKKREAEFHADTEGTTTSTSRDVEGHGSVISGSDGAWASYDPVNLYGVDALTLRVAAAEAGQIELRKDAADGELLGTADIPQTGLSTFTDVRVDVEDPGESFTLVAVFPGAGERRLNFIEANGKGVADTTRPEVAITAPEAGVELDQGEIAVTAEASDAENTITEVEFFVDGASLGTDAEAPYEAPWSVAEDGYYELTAVATNDRGVSTTSRIVVAQVGDPFSGLHRFTNAGGEFSSLGDGRFSITSGGANMWQGTDEYSSLYREGVDDTWSATVRINSQENSHSSAKAGLIVRNDVTQPGASAGYAALGIRPANGFEWLRGNDQGQLAESTNAGSTDYPAWMRLVRYGDLYYAYQSLDGEEFTQIGDPVSLPGAASVQDVGMFVTAHHASATSAVEFQDFTFDDDPQEPTPPDQGDPAPECDVEGDPDGGVREPSDEFDGTSIDGCRWDSVVRYDADNAVVADGELQITTQPGDINGTANDDPRNFVLQQAPEGDWVAETRLSAPLEHQWQLAGLLAYGDDDNYVKLDVAANNAAGAATSLGAELVSEEGAAFGSGGNRQLDVADAPSSGYWHLRLEKVGDTYQGWASEDGEEWQSLGEPVTHAEPLSSIGVMAIGPQQTAPVTVGFDWFHLTSADDVEPVGITAEAAAVCVGKQAVVKVRLAYDDVADAEVVVTTPYGTKRYPDVEPGDTPSHQFKTREQAIEGGVVSVTATVGDRTSVVDVEYDAVDCS